MPHTLDPAARCCTRQRGPEVGVPGVGVCPGAEELQHDVVVAAARRQVERGLGLVVLVIHRVAVLAVREWYLVILSAAITLRNSAPGSRCTSVSGSSRSLPPRAAASARPRSCCPPEKYLYFMKKIFEAIPPGGDLRPRLDELRDDVEVSAAAGRVQRRVVPAVVAAEQLGPARGT